jgi:hypothetical protein
MVNVEFEKCDLWLKHGTKVAGAQRIAVPNRQDFVPNQQFLDFLRLCHFPVFGGADAVVLAKQSVEG